MGQSFVWLVVFFTLFYHCRWMVLYSVSWHSWDLHYSIAGANLPFTLIVRQLQWCMLRFLIISKVALWYACIHTGSKHRTQEGLIALLGSALPSGLPLHGRGEHTLLPPAPTPSSTQVSKRTQPHHQSCLQRDCAFCGGFYFGWVF